MNLVTTVSWEILLYHNMGIIWVNRKCKENEERRNWKEREIKEKEYEVTQKGASWNKLLWTYANKQFFY